MSHTEKYDRIRVAINRVQGPRALAESARNARSTSIRPHRSTFSASDPG
jgi:hypothetical protein